MSIDLIWWGTHNPSPNWSLGSTLQAGASHPAFASLLDHRWTTEKDGFLLFWDGKLGHPDPECVLETTSLPGDLWHAGLKLGMSSRPALIDFVAPTWMFTRDPDPNSRATSWRVSLRACLMRTSVLQQLGGPLPDFESLEAAALEFGHRCLMQGAIMRHAPELILGTRNPGSAKISLEDEARFILYCYGRRWMCWALVRAALCGYCSAPRALTTLLALRNVSSPMRDANFVRPSEPSQRDAKKGVSVLIPTLARYDYLRKLLDQLRDQTIKPREIIVVDQTPLTQRDRRLKADFSDLPLRLIHIDRLGQSSARNLGLQHATGDYVLLLDDDVEIPISLIEDHFMNLNDSGADASCGVSQETGALPLPAAFLRKRVSDVFPSGNSVVDTGLMRAAGGFDPAFDGGQCEDHELGMRLYLRGALLVLDPTALVQHHRAPTGGLRWHGARVVTYSSSRTKLLHRNLPAPSEILLAKRYFTPRQVREALWLRALGTFSLRGSGLMRCAKIVTGLVLLPNTWLTITARERAVDKILGHPVDSPVLQRDGA